MSADDLQDQSIVEHLQRGCDIAVNTCHVCNARTPSNAESRVGCKHCSS
jgi:ribosomal protein L40E